MCNSTQIVAIWKQKNIYARIYYCKKEAVCGPGCKPFVVLACQRSYSISAHIQEKLLYFFFSSDMIETFIYFHQSCKHPLFG
jgi:hypothetical protein